MEFTRILLPNLINENPPRDKLEGKFSKIYLGEYIKTTGLVSRTKKKNPELIGYCKSSPKESLENLFPEYAVTSFNGYPLFGSSDFNILTPTSGLIIGPIESPKEYGHAINGTLEGLTSLEILQRLKRTHQEQTKDNARRIISYLQNEFKKNSPSHLFGEELQKDFDIGQIVSILKKFI